jgi:hypothetical protein
MKKIFKPSRRGTRGLAIIVILLTIPTPILSLAMADSPMMALIVCLIIYAAYSPLIIVLIRIIVRNLKGQIVIGANGIECVAGRSRVIIAWGDVATFAFDYIGMPNQAFGITRNYVLYEVSSAKGKFRFYRLLLKEERKTAVDIFMVAPLQKKAFSLDAYGLYMDRKECISLVDYIRDYTDREPERRKGLFQH